MKYKNISYYERKIIQRSLIKKENIKNIAKKIGKHLSTLYREIKKKDDDRPYNAELADYLTAENLSNSHKKYKTDNPFYISLVDKLIDKYSPDAISGRLKLVNGTNIISRETIYRIVYNSKYLWKYLYSKRQYRKTKKDIELDNKYTIKLPSIEKRNKKANERKEIGHWERDLLLGRSQGGAILVNVDRKSRFILAKKIKRRTNEKVLRAMKQLFKKIERKKIKSFTSDQGVEFKDFYQLRDHYKIPYYFAHTHSPWERGTVENVNKMIRKKIPKSTVLKYLTNEKLKEIINRINNTPRKLHSYRTAKEIFFKLPISQSEFALKRLKITSQ